MIQGTPTTISAVSPQLRNGVTYTFAGWSDAGAQTHLVGAVPGATGPFVATFTAGAPSCTIGASLTSIPLGGSTTLTWTASNAAAITLNNGVGALTPTSGGTRTITPAASGQYTASVTGPAGSATCSVSITVTAALRETYWRSEGITLAAGSPQGVLLDDSASKSAQLEFYESGNAGVDRGLAFDTFRNVTHPDVFNHAEKLWTAGSDNYPYVAKSTINRGSDVGESNALAPLTVRDLQLHPPGNTHYTVAAFRAPEAGTYAVSNLAARRVDSAGGTARLRLFGPAKTQLGSVQATTSRAWMRSTQTFDVGSLNAGDYIYFALDGEDGYGWDATEIAWVIVRTDPRASAATASGGNVLDHRHAHGGAARRQHYAHVDQQQRDFADRGPGRGRAHARGRRLTRVEPCRRHHVHHRRRRYRRQWRVLGERDGERRAHAGPVACL